MPGAATKIMDVPTEDAGADSRAGSESFFLATAPTTATDRRAAMGALLASLIGFAALAPFARTHLPHVPAFIPAYESALGLCELLTAVLLFGQFARLRSWALMAVACGYLFSFVMTLAHMVSFPGVFSATGLVSASPQTTAWLYCFWHGGFPLFILAYAVLNDPRAHHGPLVRGSAGWTTVAAISATVLLAGLAIWVSAVHVDALPVILVGGDYRRMMSTGVTPVLLALTAFTFVLLALRAGAVLNLWMAMVMTGWIYDVTLSAVVGSSRFDLGWYAGRVFGLVAGAFVLGVLLLEMNSLYDNLTAALAEARERNAELVRSRANLARAQRLEAVGELTGGVAHDFNNLLTAIVGGLDVILRNPADTARVVRFGENALRSAERGARLVRQLLTFARRQNLNPETVNPNALVMEFQSVARSAVGEPVELDLDLDPRVHPVRIDVGEFQAAILNLILNARDAMPSGGRLSIETRNVTLDAAYCAANPEATAGHYVAVAISDSGTGMDAATRARVFEPFFTTKPVGVGTGLGLSQVYGFARSAGGHVDIHSEPGLGATVRIYLPRSQDAGSASADRAAIPLRAARQGETVLLVEDDESIIHTSAESLRELGYRVLTASDARQALAIVQADERIDVLFSDVVMPGGMNGVQLAVEARRLRPRLKVLLTSGFAGGALRDQTIPDDLPLLGKPYRQAELAEKLRLVMRTP